MTIAAIVLAAGASSRLGHPKQLVRLRGSTLLRESLMTVRASRCDAVCAVLGANASLIAPAVADVDVAFEHNAAWSEGIASSIRCGVRWAVRAGHDSVLLCVCDQPQLSTRHLDIVMALHRATGRMVASRYAGVLGVPAVFGRFELRELLSLYGHEGARRLLDSRALTIDWAPGQIDVDTPADVAALRDSAPALTPRGAGAPSP